MGVMPPQRLKESTAEKIEALSLALANRLGIIGFLNLQLAVKDDEVFVLEANPRSSRSLPFMVKATGIPLVDLGIKAILGTKKSEVQPERFKWRKMKKVCVKGVVFPFKKFREADVLLGPEMKSTGESMGGGEDYAEAMMKALVSSQHVLPTSGEVFLSLRDKDKDELLGVIQELHRMGFSLCATGGTAKYLSEKGLPCESVKKVHEGRPNCVDRIRSGQVSFVINTTSGRQSIEASFGIRRSCIDYSVPCVTESDAAQAVILALKRNRMGQFQVSALSAPELI
jgi:carbamoyl-phosphate synthase large subunit